MLRRIGLGCFDGASFLRCGRSNWLAQRPIHLVPICSHRRKLSDSPAAPTAAAKDRSWALLNRYGWRTDDDSFLADAKAAADSFTSKGRHLRVSVAHATPPASSFIYYDWLRAAPDCGAYGRECLDVVAAHGSSVLFEMRLKLGPYPSSPSESDYFVYSPGGGAAGPPSLSLVPDPDEDFRLSSVYTGLLRRSNELRVIQLREMYDDTGLGDMAEIRVLRVGRSQWEVMEPVPIDRREDAFADGQLMDGWQPYTMSTIPVGNRFLCWVQESGFYLCDMLDEANPKVQGVRLPHDLIVRYADNGHDNDMPPLDLSKNMGAGGDSALRFVSIDSRCCCGSPSRSTCDGSRFAFTVTTWTMELGTDEPLAWVKDGTLDCEELWAQPGYEGLPRTHLNCPVLSLDNPDVVCFTVSDYDLVSSLEYKVWTIQINMRSKTLLSVAQFAKERDSRWKAYHHLPAEFQY